MTSLSGRAVRAVACIALVVSACDNVPNDRSPAETPSAAPAATPAPSSPASPEPSPSRPAPESPVPPGTASATPPVPAPSAAPVGPPPSSLATKLPESEIRASLPPLPLVPFAVPRPVQDVRMAYEFAGVHPEVLKYVPCFCGCERDGHPHNESCFVAARDDQGRVLSWDTHGMG